jgi:hemerythrin-like domain-containing protein
MSSDRSSPAAPEATAGDDPAAAALRVIHDEHRVLEAMLLTMPLLVRQRQRHDVPANFTVLRAMLCYIAEYPERLHHPKEEAHLFPALREARPDLSPVIEQLSAQHAEGEARLGRLERALTAWECLGDSRRDAFTRELDAYVRFYLSHLQAEERELLPAARKALSRAQWQEIAAHFAVSRDPFASADPAQEFRALHEMIVGALPAPLGYGAAES